MYLFGAGGHAKVIMDILSSQGIEVDGIVDEDKNIRKICGKEIIHNNYSLSPIIVSIGDNRTRKKIVEKINGEFGRAIAASAIISPSAIIGKGSVVMQGTIIQAGTIIGKHVIVNTGVSIDHECIIEDFVHISPHSTLCGNVHVGEGSWIGAGSVVIPGIKIGKWSIIGAGSVVIDDIPDFVVAVGNKCRIIKSIKNEK